MTTETRPGVAGRPWRCGGDPSPRGAEVPRHEDHDERSSVQRGVDGPHGTSVQIRAASFARQPCSARAPVGAGCAGEGSPAQGSAISDGASRSDDLHHDHREGACLGYASPAYRRASENRSRGLLRGPPVGTAWMSSRVRRGEASRRSPSVAPSDSLRRMPSTGMSVPRTTGLPWRPESLPIQGGFRPLPVAPAAGARSAAP